MSHRPWLAHYDAGVPHSLDPYPKTTLLHYLDKISAHKPDHPALIFKGSTISARELNLQSDAFANALIELGVRPQERVALLLPNIPQFMVAEFGIWKAGAIVVPINPLSAEPELEHALVNTEAETIIVLTPFYQRLKAVQERTQIHRVIATSIKDHLPPTLRILFTLFKERQEGHRINIAHGDVWMKDLVRKHKGKPRTLLPVTPDDPAVILSSGGTTGTPKGVIGLHRHYVTSGLQIQAWTKSALGWNDTILLPLPLFHVYANVGAQSLAFIGGNPLALVPNPRDISDVLKTTERVQPACFNGVPTLYTAMLNHPDVKAGKVKLSSVKVFVSGASALLSETKQQFKEQIGATIVEGYSLTESMMACCLNPVQGIQKVGSIGMPLPDVDVRIVDSETGEQELACGKVGELLLRAPQQMVGYWNASEENSETLQNHGSGQPWVHTGDLAYMDEDGYIFLVDRKKDMIKTSGFQVWPREIEEVLASHPAVMEVGVAGIPDSHKGEAPKGWIVLKEGCTVTESQLRDFCRERLSAYKIPIAIEFRPTLPKTLVGKILRRELAAEHREKKST